MAKINLPSQILQKEALKSFPAKEKEEYLSNVLKKILELNPEGVTISQIREATNLTYSTVWHHLEILACTAQAKKLSKGNVDVYHPTGQIGHLNSYSTDKAKYDVSMVQNEEGRFVCIHEKRQNRTGNEVVCRGIAIPVELIDQVIDALNKAKSPETE